MKLLKLFRGNLVARRSAEGTAYDQRGKRNE